jgi:hypothetical protein
VLYQPAFGHTIGGVELEAQMRMEGEDGAPKAMRAMDDRISNSIRLYPWAFSSESRVGKLSACFDSETQVGPSIRRMRRSAEAA